MKKTIIFLILTLILIVPIVIAGGGDYMDYVSIGQGNTLWCQLVGCTYDGIVYFNSPVYFRDNVTLIKANSLEINNSLKIKDFNGDTKILLNASGDNWFDNNVGIGTVSPEHLLDVGGMEGIGAPSNLGIKSDSGAWAIRIEENSGVEGWHIGVDVDGDLNFDDSNTGIRLTFQDETGNVGIGTTSPGRDLEIYDSSPALRIRDSGVTASATTAFIEFGGTDATAWNRTGFIGDASSGNADIYLQAEDRDLHLGDSSSATVLNLQGGNVGIGTATPVHKLEVSGSMNISGDLNVSGLIDGNGSQLTSLTHSLDDAYDDSSSPHITGDILIDGDISPNSDNARDLGAILIGPINRYWRNLYLKGNIYDGTTAISVANAKTAYDFTTNGSFLPYNQHINLKNYNIYNVSNLTIDRLNFNKDSVNIIRNANRHPELNTDNDSLIFYVQEVLPEGEAPFVFVVGNESQPTVLFAPQTGKNNSGGFWRNSFIVSSDFGSNNLTQLQDCFWIYNEVNITPRLDCDTSGYGASVLIQGGLHVFREFYVDEGMVVRGYAEFLMEGNDFDIINGSLHVRTPRVEEITTPAGKIDLVDVDFNLGSISPFVKVDEVGLSTRNWMTVSSAYCFDDLCARAKGGDSSASRIMEVNYSSVDVTNQDLSFYLSTVKTEAGDNFSVTITDNDNGLTTLLINRSSLTTNEFIFIDIPASLNEHNVSLRFNFYASAQAEEAYVDDVLLNGTAGVPIKQNITRVDTEILLGDGSQRIFWNDSTKVLELPDNVTFNEVTETTLNVTGDASIGGSLTISTLSNCDTINTTSGGELVCGDDETGAGGGVTGLDTAYDGGENVIDVDTDDVVWNLTSTKNFTIREDNNREVFKVDNTGDTYIGQATGDQIFVPAGSESSPSYSFSDIYSDTGMYNNIGIITFSSGGSDIFYIRNTGVEVETQGTYSTPSIRVDDGNTGFFRGGTDTLGVTVGGAHFFSLDESANDVFIINPRTIHDIDVKYYASDFEQTFFIDSGNKLFEFAGGYGSTGVTIYDDGNISMNGNLVIDGTCLSEGADCNADIAELTHSKASAGNTTCDIIPEHNEIITHNYYNITNEECSYQKAGEYYEYICVNITERYEFQNVSDICSDEYKEFEEGKYNKTINCVNKTPTWTEEETITIPRKTECSLNPNFELEFESGDVVCIDETDPQHIKFCDKSYDTSVVGVINYGATLIINQRAPYPLSLAGNIPVKVICNTPIEIGDLLVSSNTKGYAQSFKTWQPSATWLDMKKVWEHTGSPFAKALESCDSGNKTIRAWI